MSRVTLTIDGKQVTVKKGATVLDAARKASIDIPTLCAHPELPPYGACRMCIVQIDGMRGYPTSCTTPATDGMVVTTNSDEIVELRRGVLKLMLSGHTSSCFLCADRELCEKFRPSPTKAGKATRCQFCSNRDHCELRVLTDQYEINDLDVPIIYDDFGTERFDPFMDMDYNLCILCGRCTRICGHIYGKPVIDFVNRGKDARIGTAFLKPHTESDCRFCGACVDICPTGSLSDRFAKWHGSPDAVKRSTCTLCTVGCSIDVKTKRDKAIATQMTRFNALDRICAAGRFVLPQVLASPQRIVSHAVRVEEGLIRESYNTAVARAAEELGKYKGGKFAMLAHAGATREEIYALRKFTKDVMKSTNFGVARYEKSRVVIEPESVAKKLKDGSVKALFTTGDYLGGPAIRKLDTVVVSDMFPSKVRDAADVAFAAAGLVETAGTCLNAAGEKKRLAAVCEPPRGIVPDWRIVCDIAKKMGASGFGFRSTKAIEKELDATVTREKPPAAPRVSPLDDIGSLPVYYRGHRLTDIVPAMADVVAKPAAAEEPAEEETAADKPFRVVEKTEIVPNVHIVEVHAPVIAEKCEPGQFIIAMVGEKSERIPYTISDYDREKGTVTLVVLEAGRSSREMANVKTGDHLGHVTGPLGVPVDVKKYGTVVCAGGCFGIGAMLPVAKAMKAAGNRVICVEEASSHYLLHWRDKLKTACDELIIVTKDGSEGVKGGVQDVMRMLDERGEEIDQAYVIGCTFMMMLVCKTTGELGIPTQTAMNPLMLDGTGMCGACRVSVGGNVKFACVDGPFLDGLAIDWDELMKRQAAFKVEEIEGLPQEAVPIRSHSCTCK